MNKTAQTMKKLKTFESNIIRWLMKTQNAKMEESELANINIDKNEKNTLKQLLK